jgi:hypothetical protein
VSFLELCPFLSGKAPGQPALGCQRGLLVVKPRRPLFWVVACGENVGPPWVVLFGSTVPLAPAVKS